MINEETSRRITSLRFLLICFVVFIHNNYTGENEVQFVENQFGVYIQLLISKGIAQCAVPLFFLFSAYLQGKKDDEYKVLLKKKSLSLFIPFVLWTVIYVFYFVGLKLIVLSVAPQYIKNPDDTAVDWSAMDWIVKIFGNKLKENGVDEYPYFCGQFWFVRDLIILVILSPLLKFCIRKVPLGFLSLLTILYISQIQIYIVAEQAIFFYCLGLYWAMYDYNLFEKIEKISWLEASVLFLFSFFISNIFYYGKGMFHWFMVVFACTILLKFSKVLCSKEKIFRSLKYLSGFSFFLFAIHEPVLNESLKKLWIRFFPMKNTFFSLFEYFGVSVLVIIIGTGMGIVLKKSVCQYSLC